MLPSKIAFVDIETTGTRYAFDRIIEIGIVRVENNQIVQRYTQLINPQRYLPPEITMLTGITGKDLENQPTFQDVQSTILAHLQGCVFAAHNARFDYGFLRHEFARVQSPFSAKQCCTVKLSRYLFPTERHHNLDAVKQRLRLSCNNRHRAFDDAHLLYQFYTKIQDMFPQNHLETAIQVVMKQPSLPPKLKIEDVESLPEQPGVYIFYGSTPHPTLSLREKKRKGEAHDQIPLYIGKSKNIKDRVLSHFSADMREPIEMRIAQQVCHIETIVTAGELGALFIESQLIKQQMPLYNRLLRRQKTLFTLTRKDTVDGYPTMQITQLEYIDPEKLTTFFGFFSSRKQAKDYLAHMVKEYHLCEKLLGIEKTDGGCFSYRLGICKGACVGKENPLPYMMRFVQAFSSLRILPWPFPGPIAIEEYNSILGKKEYFLVDKWCSFGSIQFDEDNEKHTIHEATTFDLDAYKILKRYIKNPKNRGSIKLLSTSQLSYR